MRRELFIEFYNSLQRNFKDGYFPLDLGLCVFYCGCFEVVCLDLYQEVMPKEGYQISISCDTLGSLFEEMFYSSADLCGTFNNIKTNVSKLKTCFDAAKISYETKLKAKMQDWNDLELFKTEMSMADYMGLTDSEFLTFCLGEY